MMVPFKALLIDPIVPNHIYVGSELGLFGSPDGGSTWEHFDIQSGIPSFATMDDLQLSSQTDRLVAFTHGRGAFARDLMRCAGDCNGDCVVFGSEITKAVAIAGGAPACICPAADVNRDGVVTQDEIDEALENLGLGCPSEREGICPVMGAEAASLGPEVASDLEPTLPGGILTTERLILEVGSAKAAPGEAMVIPFLLTGAPLPTTAQFDLFIDSALNVADPDTACWLSPEAAQSYKLVVSTPDRQIASSAQQLRFVILPAEYSKPATGELPDGILAYCSVAVIVDATVSEAGIRPVRQSAADGLGNELAFGVYGGTVAILAP